MAPLLTLNGIPSQIAGSLNKQQQHAVISYGASDKIESHHDWQSGVPEPLQPFTHFAHGAAIKFMKWGASLSGVSKIHCNSLYLDTGETNFNNDLNLHSDTEDAISRLKESSIIVLRLLCVSSTESSFIDLTDDEIMENTLDQYRINNGRVYKIELLNLAQTEGKVIRPNPWDVIVFDAATPHLPEGVSYPHRRILQHAWVEMQLPSNWQARVKSGDVPQL